MWPGRVTRGLPDCRSAVGAHVRRTLRRMQPAGASTASGGGRPAQGALHAPVPHWRALRSCLLAAVVAALVATPAVARATVTPSSGGTRGAFEVTFAAEPVALDLQISGPGKCAELDSLEISIRRAQSGRFRFGPRVPGARPRRDGKRLRRWCRGAYRVDVVSSGEFEPLSTSTIATGRFTVS